ncbi:MAG: M23 family metallopeptidase [Lachnospiraceae bacterium]|nr:M23 family metallopeptidase [Lachnospiraceae bacterium]
MKKSIVYLFSVVLFEALLISVADSSICVFSKKVSNENQRNASIDTMINDDMKYFPIPLSYYDEVTFEDTYGAYRTNGGHEGCDILDNQNVAGRIPIISATSGVVTNIGWLYLGGYRIGITADDGMYYYYAHLQAYAGNIKAGDKVCAGQLLGFMGDSGEGEEGTTGKFPVHLHFGIYEKVTSDSEKSVNPYPYLRGLYGW